MLSLFDTYVGSVLNYGCEIWGFQNGRDVGKSTTIVLENSIRCKKKIRILQLFIMKLGDSQ